VHETRAPHQGQAPARTCAAPLHEGKAKGEAATGAAGDAGADVLRVDVDRVRDWLMAVPGDDELRGRDERDRGRDGRVQWSAAAVTRSSAACPRLAALSADLRRAGICRYRRPTPFRTQSPVGRPAAPIVPSLDRRSGSFGVGSLFWSGSHRLSPVARTARAVLPTHGGACDVLLQMERKCVASDDANGARGT
jgi:hypothetical protein